jgi:hypothetical protein
MVAGFQKVFWNLQRMFFPHTPDTLHNRLWSAGVDASAPLPFLLLLLEGLNSRALIHQTAS